MAKQKTDQLIRAWATEVTANENVISGLGLVFYDGTPGTRNEFRPGKFEALAPDVEIQHYRGDVVSCFNHDMSSVLGRESNDKLTITRSDKGICYAVETNPEDFDHVSILEKVHRKDTKGSSAIFKPLASIWSDDGVLMFTRILLIEIGPVTNPAMTATIDYSDGGGDVVADHYETQRRLSSLTKWDGKGNAGDGTGVEVRQEIGRLMDGGWTLVQIGQRVDRDPSTLSAIRSGEIKNPPSSLLAALKDLPDAPPK